MARPRRIEGFPQNPNAGVVDPAPKFGTNLAVAEAMTVDMVKWFSREDLAKIRTSGVFWDTIPSEVRSCVLGVLESKIEPRALSVVRITSNAERALQMESLRSALPAEELIQVALGIVSTGKLDGATEEVKPCDRIKVLSMLLNKVLPDSKTVEVDDRAEKSDRKRRSLKDTTKEEIAAMSESELRNLVAAAKEESV